MKKRDNNSGCINCDQDDQQTPLVVLKIKGKEYYICPQCLPTLIHKPQEIAGKLADL